MKSEPDMDSDTKLSHVDNFIPPKHTIALISSETHRKRRAEMCLSL